MARRKGLGKGKGKGWKNIIASDGYRHELSRRGIKTAQKVTVFDNVKLNKEFSRIFKKARDNSEVADKIIERRKELRKKAISERIDILENQSMNIKSEIKDNEDTIKEYLDFDNSVDSKYYESLINIYKSENIRLKRRLRKRTKEIDSKRKILMQLNK